MASILSEREKDKIKQIYLAYALSLETLYSGDVLTDLQFMDGHAHFIVCYLDPDIEEDEIIKAVPNLWKQLHDMGAIILQICSYDDY